MKKRVLVVENPARLQEPCTKLLGDQIDFVFASSMEEAKARFLEDPKPDAIVIDACVPCGRAPNTMPLVRWFKGQSYICPLIATGLTLYRMELVKVGCSHDCCRLDVVDMLVDILSLQTEKSGDEK